MAKEKLIIIKKNKRGGGWNATKCRAKLGKQVLRGHYEWCLKEGRDVSWYATENKNV
jgi:hypothetical protein